MPPRKRRSGDLCAIFVHAGAGFHSVQNERIHLDACADAAKVAMTFLKNGATAVDAVEAAISVLEDKAITNCGFGSNLTMDGIVECDATVVDHLGRSGAVGAMPQVLHPIAVARLVLDASTKPLSLRRVAPNLLVGLGATQFASENDVSVKPHSALISPGARERFLRWQSDMATDRKARLTRLGPTQQIIVNNTDTLTGPDAANTGNPRIAALRNEAQPNSPSLQPSAPELQNGSGRPAIPSPRSSTTPALTPESSPSHAYLRPEAASNPRYRHDGHEEQISGESADESDGSFIDPDPPLTRPYTAQTTEADLSLSTAGLIPDTTTGLLDGEDAITDTVGAIAVDSTGNIAAGSSSGGIGMKHRGRTGPAALVGIGTAVVPVRANDKDQTCVAAVTSGTGEHMATTMASSVCATRLYTNTRVDKHGNLVETDEDNAMMAFVNDDFMNHPSVKTSLSAAAIGVMAAKKTTDGVWLYFAHNTDSFALASMTSDDPEPHTVMSRTRAAGKVTIGARAMRWGAEQRRSKRIRSMRSRNNATNGLNGS